MESWWMSLVTNRLALAMVGAGATVVALLMVNVKWLVIKAMISKKVIAKSIIAMITAFGARIWDSLAL